MHPNEMHEITEKDPGKSTFLAVSIFVPAIKTFYFQTTDPHKRALFFKTMMGCRLGPFLPVQMFLGKQNKALI